MDPRMHYETDGFAQEEFSADSINVNCVCSWKRTGAANGPRILVNFHNGWIFDNDKGSYFPEGGIERLELKLREVERGKRFDGSDCDPYILDLFDFA